MPLPTILVMRCSVPMSATIAILVSATQKVASSVHSLMSHAAPSTQTPEIDPQPTVSQPSTATTCVRACVRLMHARTGDEVHAAADAPAVGGRDDRLVALLDLRQVRLPLLHQLPKVQPDLCPALARIFNLKLN
jgi:hypothetical protein